jgi:hypothetical protein
MELSTILLSLLVVAVIVVIVYFVLLLEFDVDLLVELKLKSKERYEFADPATELQALSATEQGADASVLASPVDVVQPVVSESQQLADDVDIIDDGPVNAPVKAVVEVEKATDLTDIYKQTDWNEMTKSIALEQTVVDSHQRFVNDPARRSARASAESLLEPASHLPTRWFGLRSSAFGGSNLGIPDYHKTVVGTSARQVPSAYNEQYISVV